MFIKCEKIRATGLPDRKKEADLKDTTMLKDNFLWIYPPLEHDNLIKVYENLAG